MRKICASFSGDFYVDVDDDTPAEEIIKLCKQKVERNGKNKVNMQIHVIQDLDTSEYIYDN